jgi:sugar-specific transcriptional regulator TrmB
VVKNKKNIQNKDDSLDPIRFLQKLNFSDEEIQIYLQLLGLGAITLAALSRTLEIPRTTIARKIEKLTGKGLVSVSIRGSTKYLIAENPRRLETWIRNQEIEIEEKMNSIKSLYVNLPGALESILKMIPTKYKQNNVVVKYFEGRKGFLDLHQETLKSKAKELLFFSNMDKWKEIFTDDFAYTYYVPERIKRKIFARTLALKSKLAEEIRNEDHLYFREMRFLPAEYDFEPTLTINDNQVLIMVSNEPYTAVMIQNSMIAEMFRNLFNNLWKVAE